MIIVLFSCPECHGKEKTTFITVKGDPYCPCSVAKIYGLNVVEAIRKSRKWGYHGALADMAEEHAKKAASFAFEARPDLRELVVGE